MRYEGIRLDENEKLLRFLNFKAEYDPGGTPVWQEIYRSSCIPYFDSGINNYFEYKYIFTTTREQDEWKIVSTTYFIGSLRFTVKNSSARDPNGGFCFIYYDEDNEKYCTKAFTEIDSKSFIYLNGINYLGKEFYNARTDYPSVNTFYNIITNKSGFYDLCILTKDTDLNADDEYTEVEIANQVSTLYDNYDYDFDLCEYTNYPLYPDGLAFFEDISLKDKEWYNRYLNYARGGYANKASNLLNNSGISSYSPRILNQIEHRLYQITEIESSGSEYAMGTKPNIVSYGSLSNPQSGMHYVTLNNTGGNIVTVQGGVGIDSVSGSGSYEVGDTVTISAIASSGYVFDKWITNDPGITIVNDQFTMPDRSVSITAIATIAPGLYQTGTTNLLVSWEDLTKDYDEQTQQYVTPIVEITDDYEGNPDCNFYTSHLDNHNLIGDLVLPHTITLADYSATEDSKQGLTGIDMSTVVYTGYHAFENCTNLTFVTLPSAMDTIEYDTFQGCTSLETIIGADSIRTVQNNAFSNTAISSIDCTINNIDSGVFYNCTALESVVLGSGSRIIGSSAFENCSNLSSITLPSTILRIDDNAFSEVDEHVKVEYGSTKANWGILDYTFDNFDYIHCTDGYIYP